MASEFGPFSEEREARDTEACRAEKSAWDANPVPGESDKWNLRMLLDAIGELGIELGAYDLSPLRQVAMYETAKCVALRGIIYRAYEAGKAAGLAGAETELGFRYQSDDGGDVTMPYPEEAIRERLAALDDISPSVRRTVVARQVTPWAPVPEATS